MSRIRSGKHVLALFIAVLCIREVMVLPSLPIIRSCRDSRIVAHFDRNQHSYCFHACGNLGIPGTNDTTECTLDGDCLCIKPCSRNETLTQPTFNYDTNICNPPKAKKDPADPNPHVHPQCISRCASLCPGGTGTICGETTTDFGQSYHNVSIYTKICTCHCPVQRCPGSPNHITTINNSNNTTVVVAVVHLSNTTTTNNNNTTLIVSPPAPAVPVLLVDPFKFLEKIEWKLVLSKTVELIWVIVKVYGVWAVQVVCLGVYSVLFYGVI